MTKIRILSFVAIMAAFGLLTLSISPAHAQEADTTATDTTTTTTDTASTDTTTTTSTDPLTTETSTETTQTTETVPVEETASQESYQEAEEAVVEDETVIEEETTESDKTISSTMVGQIIEIEGTEVPTTIIIQKVTFSKDSSGQLKAEKGDQYTVNIDSDTKIDFQLNWWMAGDMVRVLGNSNETTGLIDADTITHLTAKGRWNMGHNGWIEEINLEEGSVEVQWYGKLTKVNITDETRIIIPGKGDVTINDLQLHDRVRVRGERVDGDALNAQTIMVLRRGETKFIKLRTKKMLATFIQDMGNGTFTVEGRRETYTMNVTEDTKILIDDQVVSDLSGFTSGDRVFLATRLNDDGTFDAKLVRNFVSLEEGGAVYGTITRLDENNTVIAMRIGGLADHIGSFRVDLTSSTVIQDEAGTILTVTDLKPGTRVKVEGSSEEKKRHITASTVTVVNTKVAVKRIQRTAGQ